MHFCSRFNAKISLPLCGTTILKVVSHMLGGLFCNLIWICLGFSINSSHVLISSIGDKTNIVSHISQRMSLHICANSLELDKLRDNSI